MRVTIARLAGSFFAVLSLITGVFIGASPAIASAVVTVSVDCTGDVSLRADIGDTTVFDFASPGCDYVTSGTPKREWNLWNVNSTDPTDVTAASGYLLYFSGGNTLKRGFSADHVADWYVATRTTGPTLINTTLRATNDAGETLAVGDTIAIVNNAYFTTPGGPLVYYAVTWLGPRTSSGGAAGEVVTVSVDCTRDVSFRADFGDTILFDFASPSCNFVSPSTPSRTWNLWNVTDAGPSDVGTASGYLLYFSGGDDDEREFSAYHVADWYVATLPTGPTVMNTTLRSTNDAGAAILAGDTVAMVNNDYYDGTPAPVYYAVSWLGPRTSGSNAITGPGPENVIQQIGQPATGCEAVDRDDLNWAGVTSGGWGASWAQWENLGQGGPICTRTLVYDQQRATWTVALATSQR